MKWIDLEKLHLSGTLICTPWSQDYTLFNHIWTCTAGISELLFKGTKVQEVLGLRKRVKVTGFVGIYFNPAILKPISRVVVLKSLGYN